MPLGLLNLLCSLQVSTGAKEFPSPTATLSYEKVMERGRTLRKNGRFTEALESFRRASQLARASHDASNEAQALLLESGCELHLSEYREALQSADAVRQLALQLNDKTLAGAAANNKATVYSQLGDDPQAREAAREATVLLRESGKKGYLVRALLNYGSIEYRLGNLRDAAAALSEGVQVAHASGLADLEALGQNQLGESLLDAKDLAGAEKAFNDSLRIREKLRDLDGLASTNADLAELEYRKGDYPAALRRINAVITSGRLKGSGTSEYYPSHLQGSILLRLGRKSQALNSFQKAVSIADEWRLDALPGDATRTHTVVALHEVYQDFIELAADLSVEKKDPALARRAFEVLAQNRAASLREQLLSSFNREMRLPPRYFELLQTLANTQARVTLDSDSKKLGDYESQLQKTRLELTDIENKLGFSRETFPNRDDKNSGKNSLRSIQLSLTSNELLLCFTLGEGKSFLWAVTRDHLNLHELPGQNIIAAHAKAYSRALLAGSSSTARYQLSRELFGKLSPAAMKKKEWLVVADGVLLENVPFSFLPDVSEGGDAAQAPLIARHSLRFLPGPLMLTDRRPEPPSGTFVGVADPIYNSADPRWKDSFKILPVRHTSSGVTVARLVGSDHEIKTAASRSGLSAVTILTGPNASILGLRSALQEPPRILHFAVHVLSPAERQDGKGQEDAALALTLTRDNVPELLTKEAIATLRVPGSLVVLSGCSSQQGKNLPSAGLVGLTRAWLLAGASAVIASAWPTPDDSGQFFSTFYGHLQTPASGNLAQQAATALQETQLDMQHSTGYRNSPSFWAAYSLISKE